MPFAGLGLHFILAILCAIHAHSRQERGAMNAVRAAVKAIDPQREVREARQAFEAANARFGTFEAKAEYAIWACAIGDTATAERLRPELEKIAARWSPLTRELNAPEARRLEAAQAAAARPAAAPAAAPR